MSKEINICDLDTISDVNVSNIKSLVEQIATYMFNNHIGEDFLHIVDTAYWRSSVDMDFTCYSKFVGRALRLLTKEQRSVLAIALKSKFIKEWELDEEELHKLGYIDDHSTNQNVDALFHTMSKRLWKRDWQYALIDALDKVTGRKDASKGGKDYFEFVDLLLNRGHEDDLYEIITVTTIFCQNNDLDFVVEV